MGYFPTFCWSDQWWIEGKTAWFVTAETNILMRYDIENETGRILSKIPHAQGLRWNPQCMKWNDEIICFPDRGVNVWIYSLKTDTWEEVIIPQEKNRRKTCQFIYRDGSDIYFVSRTLGSIYILDMATRKIAEYPMKDLYSSSIDSEFRGVSNGIVIEQNMYLALAETSYILIFNRVNKEFSVKKIGIEIQIMRIQADQGRLWMVGLDKAIYIWDPNEDTVTKIVDFPKTFGGYVFQDDTNYKISLIEKRFGKPLFCAPVFGGESIWLIPWYGTEILYIDKKTRRVNVFEIEGEKAGKGDLDMLGARYFINYTREDRYLGIFSSKSGREIEIDMKENTYRYLDMIIKKDDILFFSPIRERNGELLQFLLDVLNKNK